MAQLFRRDGERLLPVKRTDFSLEKQLQGLCEANLSSLFGLDFVRTEFPIKSFRIDTLAYDPNSASFVIIEYKRGSNMSVVDQGFAYLNVLHGNPAEFVLAYNESTGTSIKKEDVDWKRSRVYFVAPSFTLYQRQAVNFRDLPIDLWEVAAYDDGTLVLSHVGDEQNLGPSVSQVGVGVGLGSEAKQAVQYSVDDHLEGRPGEIRRLYTDLQRGLVSIGEVSERAISVAVLFESPNGRFAEVIPQKKQILVHVDRYDGNPRGLTVRDFIEEGKGRYWAVGDYQIRLFPGDDVGPAVELARASYGAVMHGSE